MLSKAKGGAIWLGILSMLFLSAPSRANDSEAELSMGGLVLKKSDHIEMRSEDLFISSNIVRVKYRFINRSKEPVTTIVAFPIPDYDTRDEDAKASNDDTFQTSVNGAKVQVAVERKAFVGAVDVTEILARVGISAQPNDVAKINDIAPEALAGLVAKNIVQTEEYRVQPSGEKKTSVLPRWTLRTNYYWEQTFPPGKEMVVEHSYRPVIGGSAGSGLTQPREDWYPETLSSYRKKYCVEDSLVRTLRNQNRHEIWISYILSTGANWAGPIGDFRLVVDKGQLNSLVSFCADGVKKISATQFEVRKKNFIPKDDLHIVIFWNPNE